VKNRAGFIGADFVPDWCIRSGESIIRRVLKAGLLSEIYNVGDWNEKATVSGYKKNRGKHNDTTQGQLNVEIMDRGYAWLDTGTHDSLLEASSFIATLQKRQGLQVACPEEIALSQGWVNAAQIQKLAAPLAKNGYCQYLLSLLKSN